MMRARWLLASLLPLALTRCALSDDFALEPDGPADSKADPAPPPAKGGSTSGPGTTDRGGSTGGTVVAPGGKTGMLPAGGVGGASAGSGGITGPDPTRPGDAGEAGVGPIAGKGGATSTCVPEPEICDGISNDCDAEIDEDGACPSDCSVKSYDGHLYALCLFPDEAEWATYDQARTSCAKLGPQIEFPSDFALTAIESKPENDFLKEWIKQTTPISKEVMVWSGANDIEQERTWVWGQGASAVRFFDQARDGGGKAVGTAFEDFPPDKPNSANDWDEDCGGFDSELAWQWNDFKCEDPRLGYVCEEVP